jgi:hypothetical protein
MKPFNQWTVLPHSRLTRLEDNLLCVTGVMHMPPMGEVERRMTVVRLADGRLVIWSAIALDEAEMQELERFGRPSFLIVPGDLHRMDAKIWRDRYPGIFVVAPEAARAKVEEVVAVDGTTCDFGDPTVRYFTVPGTGEREAALMIEGETGVTLVLNDLIFDLHNRPGVRGMLFKWIGMTGDQPHIPPVIRMRKVVDKEQLRAQLARWASLANLKRVIISHGDIIEKDPSHTLSAVAAQLAA